MGCFLLNELGEVLLEIKSGLLFNKSDVCLEVHEKTQTAVLKCDNDQIKIDFVHEALFFPLKMNRYVFVVERNNQFYATKSLLASVVFVE